MFVAVDVVWINCTKCFHNCKTARDGECYLTYQSNNRMLLGCQTTVNLGREGCCLWQACSQCTEDAVVFVIEKLFIFATHS